MASSFDWWCPKVNPSFQEKVAGRFAEAGRREIEERARLLMHLKFDAATAASRIRDRIAWEFELSKMPAFAAEVDAIVERVYRAAK
jgi:hypothetical protein